MTTSLSKVISLKDQILALAEAFGFSSNVKIYTPEFMDISMDTDTIDYELIILVSQKSEESISYKNAIFLQAKLVDLLKCQVTIINYNAVSELDQYNYDQRSRALSDSSLLQLFGKASNDEITFKTLDNEDIDMQNILLKQAEEVLKKNKPNQLMEAKSLSPSFFPTDNPSSSIKPEDIYHQVLTYLMSNEKLWKSLKEHPENWDNIQQSIKENLQMTSSTAQTIR